MLLGCSILVQYTFLSWGDVPGLSYPCSIYHSCLGDMFLVVLSFFDSNIAILCGKERSEDIKGVIRSRNSKKNKQYKDKRHQDKQWPASRLTEGKNWTTRIPLTHESELRCSENRFNNQRLTGIYIFSLGSEIVCRKISKF